MEKLLVILDLDETLIHANPIALERQDWDFEYESYKVYKRPFLDEFLKELPKHFKVAVWSSASDDYVQYIVIIFFLIIIHWNLFGDDQNVHGEEIIRQYIMMVMLITIIIIAMLRC